MSLIRTPVYTDNFTPDANPLNPTNWEVWGVEFFSPSAQALGGVAESTSPGVQNGNLLKTSTGVPTDDHYCEFTVTAFNVADFSEVSLAVRSDLSEHGYQLVISPADEGNVIGLLYRVPDAFFLGQMFDGASFPLNLGDTFTLAAVGSTLYVLLNGVPALTASDSTYPTGRVGFFVQAGSSAGETTIADFVAGSASASVITTFGSPIVQATGGTVASGTGFATVSRQPNKILCLEVPGTGKGNETPSFSLISTGQLVGEGDWTLNLNLSLPLSNPAVGPQNAVIASAQYSADDQPHVFVFEADVKVSNGVPDPQSPWVLTVDDVEIANGTCTNFPVVFNPTGPSNGEFTTSALFLRTLVFSFSTAADQGTVITTLQVAEEGYPNTRLITVNNFPN